MKSRICVLLLKTIWTLIYRRELWTRQNKKIKSISFPAQLFRRFFFFFVTLLPILPSWKRYCFHHKQKFVRDVRNSVCYNPLKLGSRYANRVLHARTVDLCSWRCGAGPQSPLVTVMVEEAGGWTAAQLRTVLMWKWCCTFCWNVSLLGCCFTYNTVHYSTGTALVTLELTPKQI